MPIVNRLKKSFSFEFISDGMGSKYNLVNTKGMNIFVESDTLVECSFPSIYEVLPILDGLGLKDSNQNKLDISKIIALDKLQQAIGRNCGYRATDKDAANKTCIILCEPKLFTTFTSTSAPVMRYWVDDINKVDHPKRRVGFDEKPSTLLDGVFWFVAHHLHYLKNGIGKRGQAFEDDFKEVALSIGDKTQRNAFKKRVFQAMKSLIDDKRLKDESLKEKLSKWFEQWGGELILKDVSRPG